MKLHELDRHIDTHDIALAERFKRVNPQLRKIIAKSCTKDDVNKLIWISPPSTVIMELAK